MTTPSPNANERTPLLAYPLALLALLALAGHVSAWTLGDGVDILQDDTTITVNTGTGIDVETTLTFEAATNAVILDGATLDLNGAGAWAWDLTTFYPSSAITLTGDAATDGTARVNGLPGSWLVLGLPGDDFTTDGTGGDPWTVPAGDHTMTLVHTTSTELEAMAAFFEELTPYLPFLIWGVLFLFFLTRERTAWFPAIASLFVCIASLFDPPVFGVQASVMIVMLAVFLHALVNRNNLNLFGPKQEA